MGVCCHWGSHNSEVTPPVSVRTAGDTEARVEASSERHAQPGETLLVSGSNFGGKLLGHLRVAAKTEGAVRDMVMISGFGADPDGEKALCVAVSLQRMGLVGTVSVVANTGDAQSRALLAKGTLQELGAAGTAVAAGSHGGCPELLSHPYELESCGYLASEQDLEAVGGHELVFIALEAARVKGRELCFVLNSALTDMAAILEDPRWPEARSTVSCITIMGGVKKAADGSLSMDASASNNHFDLEKARETYAKLQEESSIEVIVVSRLAAAACQLPHSLFQGSLHPVARRLHATAQPALQACWQSVHLSALQREQDRVRLPARCDPAWYRKAFLVVDAPANLGPLDEVWEYVRGFSEYGSLATVIAAAASVPTLLAELVVPQQCSRSRLQAVGIGTAHGLRNAQGMAVLLRELMAMAIGGGSGSWLRRAAKLAESREPVDALVVGDYGKDLDDEKALCILVAMQRIGLVDRLSVVANLGDAKMRARLAKGTLQALNASRIPVAVGSHGGNPGEELYEHEFAHCTYLAPEEDLQPASGHQLMISSLESAQQRGRKAFILLCSALTDMAQVLDDPRWARFHDTISCVVAMGGVKEQDGEFVIDPTAANNAFDLPAALRAYASLQSSAAPPFIVVTRFAASACQLPRNALEGASHPVADRFVNVSQLALQTLWERTHRSPEERLRAKDSLPARCDAVWFRKTFLLENTPEELGAEDEIWRYVKGFNEYDGLSAVVAVAASHPPLLNEFFQAQTSSSNNLTAIGLDAQRHNVANTTQASELLHDCLIVAFECRFRTGVRVEVKDGEKWKPFQLTVPKRALGPDAWLATDYSDSVFRPKLLYLQASLEGQTWRFSQSVTFLGSDEPVIIDDESTQVYRKVNGQKRLPIQSQAAWNAMREGWTPTPGDVMTLGPNGSGKSSLLVMCLALRHSKGLEGVDLSQPYVMDLSVARGRTDVADITRIPHQFRVFKLFEHRRHLLPWRTGPTPFPPGVKIIYTVRDPRDLVVHIWEAMFRGLKLFADPTAMNFSKFLKLWHENSLGWGDDWLASQLDWWEMSKAHPDQVLWVVFEEMLREPSATVRRVSKFLGKPVNETTVAQLAEVTAFSEMKRRFGKDLGPLLRKGLIGGYVDYFSSQELARFREEVIEPALAAGMHLAEDVRYDKLSV